jgi:hypothetical protein
MGEKKYPEALSSARSYYDLAHLNDSAGAIDLVALYLALAKPMTQPSPRNSENSESPGRPSIPPPSRHTLRRAIRSSPPSLPMPSPSKGPPTKLCSE